MSCLENSNHEIRYSQDGVSYVHDNDRGVCLSTYRFYVKAQNIGMFNRVRLNIDQSIQPYLIARDATITAITMQSGNSAPWKIEIHSMAGDQVTTIDCAQERLIECNMNINLHAGDQIYFMCEGNEVFCPIAIFEIAWRLPCL